VAITPRGVYSNSVSIHAERLIRVTERYVRLLADAVSLEWS